MNARQGLLVLSFTNGRAINSWHATRLHVVRELYVRSHKNAWATEAGSRFEATPHFGGLWRSSVTRKLDYAGKQGLPPLAREHLFRVPKHQGRKTPGRWFPFARSITSNSHNFRELPGENEVRFARVLYRSFSVHALSSRFGHSARTNVHDNCPRSHDLPFVSRA